MRSRRLIAGRYRLQEQLGSGGMGVVWRATDEELHRVVAVKRALSAEGAHEPQRAKLLKREAMAVAKVNHPNVVTLFDIVAAGDELWLVMEYLPARNLADQGTLPPSQVAAIGAQLASALEAVHAAGVLHRDVKPSNVLMTDDRRAKLSDFGISRNFHADVTLSHTGGIDGTPGYLAPEVARGEDATTASDMFSLGATLFAAVEGVSPVGRAANPQVLVWRSARGDISESHRGGPLAPVLSALLRPDPRKRPDAAQAREMLEAVSQGVRVRRPLALARVGILAILLVVIVGLLSFPNETETSAEPTKVAATIGSILGDTRTADPCALLDAAELRRFGETEVDPDYGNFNRCDVLIRPKSGEGEVDVTISFSRVPENGEVPPGLREQVGDFAVIKHPAYDGEQCDRTVMLPDNYTLPIRAQFTHASFPVDLCAVADSTVSTVFAKFAQGVVPRRQVTRPASSAINLNACALPDSDILALLPGVDATSPERSFGDWECRWHSTTSSIELLVRFDQRLPLTASDGQAVQFAGHAAALDPDGYGENTCAAYIEHRRYTNAIGRPRIEALLVVTLGSQPRDRLCKLVSDIAEPLAAKLPG